MSSTQQLLLGEGAGGAAPVYIEDVFSTWLYNGDSSTQTITNGIDLSTKGGLVWSKYRISSFIHNFFDTARGVQKTLCSNNTDAQATETQGLTAFNSDGYTIGPWSQINSSSGSFVSWTFREQPKFFDVVTYTGNGATNRTVAHNLGSTPGCIIVKRTDDAGDWWVYHRSLGATKYLTLNSSSSEATYGIWGNTNPTSTDFTVNFSETNGSGRTYVAYLFAHDAGGFGLTGSDNVISCGSYVGDGTTKLINVGYEPQLVLIKNVTNTGGGSAADWRIIDNMRGFTVFGNNSSVLKPNTSGAEANDNPISIDPSGFYTDNLRITGETYIYITIRRGPMKTPTSATTVFTPTLYSGTGAYNRIIDTTITPDMILNIVRSTAGPDKSVFDRLRGWPQRVLYTNLNYAEGTGALILANPTTMNSIRIAASGTNYLNYSPYTYVNYSFKRAPGFFDEVCYIGTGSGRTITHNLGVAPELMIIKSVGDTFNWPVYGPSYSPTNTAFLNLNGLPGASSPNPWNSTAPTASVFSVGTANVSNANGVTYVAYLFATLAGVSKVGSYTGTGGTQTINCGFTGGARFVMIKSTNNPTGTGDWYVWDSERGMVSGTDPSSALNNGNAEVNANSVYTVSTGFQIVSTVDGINSSGSTYIFLAIA